MQKCLLENIVQYFISKWFIQIPLSKKRKTRKRKEKETEKEKEKNLYQLNFRILCPKNLYNGCLEFH